MARIQALGLFTFKAREKFFCANYFRSKTFTKLERLNRFLNEKLKLISSLNNYKLVPPQI